MDERNLPPIREQDLWVANCNAGKLELTASYNRTAQCWRVRLKITDERVREAYDYCEHIKLPETAPKYEVLRAAVSQITRWFRRVSDVWLPILAEAVKSR